MLHLCILKFGIMLAYYTTTFIYPMKFTYGALKKDKLDNTSTIAVTYWVMYGALSWFDAIFFFISE